MKKQSLIALALAACLTVGCLSACTQTGNPDDDDDTATGFTWTGLDSTIP